MDRALKKLTLAETEKQALDKIITYLRAEWPQVRVLIYGSKVRGNSDEESDVDLLVLLPCTVGKEIRQRIIHEVFEVNLALESNISVLIVSQNEWETGLISILPIHDFIEEEGIAL